MEKVSMGFENPSNFDNRARRSSFNFLSCFISCTGGAFITLMIGAWFYCQSRMPCEYQSGVMSLPSPLVQSRLQASFSRPPLERPRVSSGSPSSTFENPLPSPLSHPPLSLFSLSPFHSTCATSPRSCTPFTTLTITSRVLWLEKHTPQLASPSNHSRHRRKMPLLLSLPLLSLLGKHRLLHL